MRRLLPTEVFNRTLATDKFSVYLTNTLISLHHQLDKALSGGEAMMPPEFKM